MTSDTLHRYTPEEYLAIERGAPFRSEYRDGRIVATNRHDFIAGKLYAELSAALPGPGCTAFLDLRVRIEHGNRYVYPDVAALCEEPRFEDGVLDTLMNPALVVEVLSASTEAYDRGEKFAAYRRIESLREYVLFAQDRVSVDRYRRSGDLWTLTAFDSADDVLELDSVGASLRLAEIYEGVELG